MLHRVDDVRAGPCADRAGVLRQRGSRARRTAPRRRAPRPPRRPGSAASCPRPGRRCPRWRRRRAGAAPSSRPTARPYSSSSRRVISVSMPNGSRIGTSIRSKPAAAAEEIACRAPASSHVPLHTRAWTPSLVIGRTPVRCCWPGGGGGASGSVAGSRMAPVTSPTSSWPSVSDVRRLATVRPARMTCTWSERRRTCSKLWLISRMVTPLDLSSMISSSTRAVSCTPSAAEGSSSTISLEEKPAARAIDTAWRWPPTEATYPRVDPRHVDRELADHVERLAAHPATVEEAAPGSPPG